MKDLTVKELEQEALHVRNNMDKLHEAWIGQKWKPNAGLSYQDYRQMLAGANPKMRELILQRAAIGIGTEIAPEQLQSLVDFAYPTGGKDDE